MSESDLLNWQTMIVELTIAFAGAGMLAGYFYRKEKKRQEKTDDKIDEINKALLQAGETNKDALEQINATKKIVEKQNEVIEKQGAIIKKQEEKEQIMIDGLRNDLTFNLQRARLVLLEIDRIFEQETSSIPLLSKREQFLSIFDSCIKQMNNADAKLSSLEIRIPHKVSDAHEKIFVYSRDFGKALDEDRGILKLHQILLKL